MHKSNRSLPWVNQKNRTTVGNINTQKDTAIASDDCINPRAFGRRFDRHDSDSVAMNLFSKPGLARQKSSSDALMIRVEPAKSGRSIALDVEPGDSQRKPV